MPATAVALEETPVQKITSLKLLLDSGALSPAEFEAKKAELLKQV